MMETKILTLRMKSTIQSRRRRRRRTPLMMLMNLLTAYCYFHCFTIQLLGSMPGFFFCSAFTVRQAFPRQFSAQRDLSALSSSSSTSSTSLTEDAAADAATSSSTSSSDDDDGNDDYKNDNNNKSNSKHPDDLIYQTNLKLAALAQTCGSRTVSMRQRTAAALEAYRLLRSVQQHQRGRHGQGRNAQQQQHADTVAYNSVLKAFSKISPCRISHASLLLAMETTTTNKGSDGGGDVENTNTVLLKLKEEENAAAGGAVDSSSLVTLDAGGGDHDHDDDDTCTADVESIIIQTSTSSSTTSASASVAAAAVAARPITLTTAAEHAEQLLREMKVLYEHQSRANQEWYDKLQANALNDSQVSAGPPRVYVKPNVRSYSTVMDAYARVGTREAACRVDELLQELLDRCDQYNDNALQPNIITYNTCLTAWAKAKCPHECLQRLESMPVPPDVISYNIVLHAIARSGWPNAGERAQALLDSMSSSAVKTKPNGRSYTTCMDAWSQSGRADKAHALLQEMLDLYDNNNHQRQMNKANNRGGRRDSNTRNDNKEDTATTFRPNCVSFATVIHAYAVSKDPHKAVKSFRLFQDMRRRGIPRNRVVLNNLLNCFATASPPDPATAELVVKLYDQILEHYEPDHYTFGTVLKAAANNIHLLPFMNNKNGDSSFSSSVFREACRRGQVSDGVLWQLRQAVPVDTYRELVGSDRIDIHSIPREWTANVRENEQQQRPRRYSSSSS